jgi:hypothetical protein
VVPSRTFTYTPFPSPTLAIDFGTGRFADTQRAPAYVLTSPSDPRFGLAGSEAAQNAGLGLLLAVRPYRARWATRGLAVDGWTRPGRPVTVRVYAEPGQPSRRTGVTVLLDSPPEAKSPVRYRLGTSSGSVAPATQSEARSEVCVPAGGHADLTLVARRAATILGPPLGPYPGPPRTVGPVVSGVRLETLGGCAP